MRDAADDTYIVTNGFSCREQIEQATGRTAVHVAELLAAAIRQRDVTSATALAAGAL